MKKPEFDEAAALRSRHREFFKTFDAFLAKCAKAEPSGKAAPSEDVKPARQGKGLAKPR